MPTVSYKQVCIEVADDWTATSARDSTYDFLSITPSTHKAQLRLTTFDSLQMTAKDWVEFAAHANRLKNRPVLTTKLGPLKGYEVQFISDSDWIRGWVLECDGIPLDISYRCDEGLRGIDDSVIDTMLKSLNMDTKQETL